MPPRQALRRLWLMVRLLWAASGVLVIVWASTVLAARPFLVQYPIVIGRLAYGATFLVTGVVFTPPNRGAIHRRLGKLTKQGGRGTEEEEAAAISALVAGADPETALTKAAALFRCLPACQLHAADLADNTGAPPTGLTLHERTTPAVLGDVTAFLSHSWNDEKAAPGAKHIAITRWARRHRKTTGKEPTFWLVRSLPSCARHPVPHAS